MEPYAIITPTRDRPKMLEFCKYQVSQFTIQPEKHYIIDYAPVSDSVDISERVFMGVQQAKADGIDLVFIAEDDDFLPFNYIERYGDVSQHDFFGSTKTTYYHLLNKTYQDFIHPMRSSLFTTGFRVSSVEKFIWPRNNAFVDIELWKHAKTFRKKFIMETGAVGMKGHGFGKSGGKGHQMRMAKSDHKYNWLRRNVSCEAFEFYMSLI
jgi:hypothetical protein